MIVYFVSDATILVFTKYCGKYCIIFYSAAEPGVISSAKKKRNKLFESGKKESQCLQHEHNIVCKTSDLMKTVF